MLAGLKDTDKIGFYSLGSKLTMVRDFNEDAAPLVRMAKLLQSGGNADGLTGADLTLYKALNESLSPMQDLQNQSRVTITQAAMPAVTRHLAGVPGRKNLVWVVSRFPLTYGNAAERRREDEAEVQAFANLFTEANISLYPVDPGGNGASFNTSQAAPAAAEGSLMATRGQVTRSNSSTNTIDTASTAAATSLTGNQTFKKFAEATGGKAFVNSNDIGPALREVVDSGTFTYTLGFTPDEKTMDDKPHKLEVKLVKKPATDKTRLTFRKEYLAWGPKSGPNVHPRPSAGDLLADPLDATAIGLVGVANLDPSKPGYHQLDIRVSASDLDFQRRADKWVGAFDMVVSVEGQAGASAQTFNVSWTDAEYQEAFRNGFIAGSPVQTDGGKGIFLVIIQDKGKGTVGSIRVPFASK
jgi:VWFA-related protein